MTAKILDGKALATVLREEIRQETERFTAGTGIQPGLAVVLVGDDPASGVYVRNKETATIKAGMKSVMKRLPAETTTEELLALVGELNADTSIHGILVQLPLPRHIDERRILDAIDPRKDVDAFHPENVGLIAQGRPRFLPCTPYGIQQLLIRSGIETAGKNVVVLGRSNIVGKPMALLLMQKGPGGDATVTVCHSRTANLAEVTRSADILIVAIGVPRFLKADGVKPGAVVIDVGMNRIEEDGKARFVGDVDFDAVEKIASAITPVPGGVGPLTVTMLLNNALTAARNAVS
ncbi:MAG: bifunctional methylenetetrahydrofolate dehydrogenase/methenyltetrahydrofolate cyclohydrolase FolD [Thermoguttaceae bacterium]|nr:bifunctional methylenetetrahydrofolate dehydrogenase/methenyltetrahydrofolate cyclohydrolase FolD [Thermoguttaceae bacterium]MBQ6619947.1 bifunctional methylenetetrahydrofolate dehydrogenase/methenyltetrahydrofolate cyclohydrolase FolD [Thermoguttaceae bacterium]